MTTQASLTAELVAGPASVSDNPFPSGVTTIPFGLNPPAKQYNVDTGKNVATVNSPSAFVALGGVGALGPVTQGHTLYIRTIQPMTIRETTAVPSSADNVVVYPLNGVTIREYPADHYLKLIEVEGAGQIEYWAAGNQ
jgi:hypothetical protein